MTAGQQGWPVTPGHDAPTQPDAPDTARRRPYAVHVVHEKQGWVVQIIDPSSHVMFARPCQTEADARTFGSTVQQHLYWLSAGKFREYYRLSEPA